MKLNVVLPFWTSWSCRRVIWKGGEVAAGRAEGKVARSRRTERKTKVTLYMVAVESVAGRGVMLVG